MRSTTLAPLSWGLVRTAIARRIEENPRLALVWSTSYQLTTKFLYGEAFRAPSFAQTRAINNPLILGNLDLKPEEIKSYELAFAQPVFLESSGQIKLVLNLLFSS